MGVVVDDQVHAQHRGQGRDRKRDGGDDGEAFRGYGHLRVGAGLVELDRALQVGLLGVRHDGQVLELVDRVLQQVVSASGPKASIVTIRAYTSRLRAAMLLDGEQAVAGTEHLVEKSFRVAEMVAGDALLERPDVAGQGPP